MRTRTALLTLLSIVATLALVFAALPARADPPPTDPFRAFPFTPQSSRALVNAALRASGLDTGDAVLDAMAQTSRTAAWVPELRLRAARTDDDHTTLLFTDPTHPYETSGVKMMYEARLSWRLDHLIYSGEEPQIEHLRIVRIEARERLTHKTLEVFFALERNLSDLARAIPGSAEAEECGFRAFEAAATLDVLTAGWFSSRLADGARGKAATAKK